MKEQRRQERVAKRMAAVGVQKKGKEAELSGKAKKEHMRELARQRRAAAEAEKAGAQSYTTSASRWGKETKVSVTDTKKSSAPPQEEMPKKPLVDLMID